MNIEHIAEGIGLKKAGGEYKGPCPCCGGNDRFHIKTGRSGNMMVYCRYLCSYSSIMRELEDRGLVEKDEFERKGPTASQKAVIAQDRLVMALYEADRKVMPDPSLADFRRYRLAKERYNAMAPMSN